MPHALANLALPALGPLKAVRVALVVVHGLVNILLLGDDKGAVLDDFLLQRQAGDEHDAGVGGSALGHRKHDLVARLREDDVVVLRNLLLVQRVAAAGHEHGARQRVRKRVPARGQRLRDATARPDCNVEQPDGRVGQLLQAVDAVALARNDFDADLAVGRGGLWDLRGPQVAVAWFARLERLGQVDPELHADVRAAVCVLSRHLGMHDSPAGRHELQVSRLDGAFVAGKVFVVDGPREQVSNCFLAAVWVVWEAGARADAEVVEHQERSEVA